MAGNQKIEEGLEHIRQAEKSMKTSFLKWRPDYDSAADSYNKAAICFKTVRSFQQCKDCLMKATECYKQNRSLFSAAKCLEQAVLICKELGTPQEICQLSERAANLFQQHGSPESASATLEKAAKLVEQQNPEFALRHYQRAADIAIGENNTRQGVEFLSKASRILVRLQMYDQAADNIRREIGIHQLTEQLPCIGRLAVALVLVQLARGDYVAAEKAFKEWGNCCETEEVQTLEMLLQGFDDEDPEMARRALNSPFIKHMDIDYAKLARDLRLPQGIAQPVQRPSVRENAAPSYVSPNAQHVLQSTGEGGDKDDKESSEAPVVPSESVADGKSTEENEEDYEGGLC